MKGYAILYKREFFRDSKDMWILKPVKIVKAKYNEENDEYIWNGKDTPSIHNLNIKENPNDFYIGVLGDNSGKFLEGFNFLKAKKVEYSLICSMADLVTVGIYDENDRSISYRSIRSCYPEDDIRSKFDYPNKTIEEIEKGFIEDQNFKKTYNFDITCITPEDIELLNKIDNYDDMKEALNYLINSKENTYVKQEDIKQKEIKTLYMLATDYIIESIYGETLEEIKSNLEKVVRNLKTTLTNFKNRSSEDKYSIESIKKNFDKLYNITSLDELKESLEIYQGVFILDIEELKKMEEKEPKTFAYYDFCSNEINRMASLNNLDEIKEELKVFNRKQLEKLSETEVYKRIINKYSFDYKKVREQLISKIINRDTQIDRIMTTIQRNDRLTDISKRQSMIIAGPTGTGKTKTFYELKNALKDIRPVLIVDTNQLTQAGFVGGTIENNILLPLINEAHRINNGKNIEGRNCDFIDDEDIELARHGIVFLDEIDKRTDKGDSSISVNTAGVINQLLKFMDPGTSYYVAIDGEMIEFDTSRLNIFAGGAFQEYFDKKKNHSIGFTENTSDADDFAKYKEVDPLELVKFGLDIQYVGRCDRVTFFEPHNEDLLSEMESNKESSNLQEEIEIYKEMSISFVWEKGYIEEVGKRAYKIGTGGRATKNIINRSLDSLDIEVNNHKDEIKTIYVPIKALDDSGNIVIIKKDNQTVLLRDLKKETERRNKELKDLQKIVVNQEALKEAEELVVKTKVLELK